jgi:hypothetical protein
VVTPRFNRREKANLGMSEPALSKDGAGFFVHAWEREFEVAWAFCPWDFGNGQDAHATSYNCAAA